MPSDQEAVPSSPAPQPAANVSAPETQPALKLELPAPAPQSEFNLGRLIASRTTDLLAIAIIVAASLALGRQTLKWWRAEPPPVLDLGPLNAANTEWGAEGAPVNLQFGDSPFRMTRRVLPTGGSQAALDAARERCQEILVAATSPTRPLDDTEREQLQMLARMTPELEQPGSWQIYLIGGRMPVVVGVKSFPSSREKSVEASPATERRVICWGLVFSGLTRGTWIAYTFERIESNGPGPGTDRAFDLAQLPLPADCQRTLLMQESGQAGLLGFQGEGTDDVWQRHFTNWLEHNGWTRAKDWQASGESQSAQFIKREGQSESMLQLQYHRQANGRVIGLVQLLPGRATSSGDSE